MRKIVISLAALLALAVSGCAPQVDVEADKAAIRDLTDVQWLNAAQAKDVDTALSYYADEASVMPPNATILTGKEAIRARHLEVYSRPGFAITWQTTKIEVSRAGDLAYTIGTFELTVNDAEGNPVTTVSKYVTVWKKQADGQWKVVADIFNRDAPAASE